MLVRSPPIIILVLGKNNPPLGHPIIPSQHSTLSKHHHLSRHNSMKIMLSALPLAASLARLKSLAKAKIDSPILETPEEKERRRREERARRDLAAKDTRKDPDAHAHRKLRKEDGRERRTRDDGDRREGSRRPRVEVDKAEKRTKTSPTDDKRERREKRPDEKKSRTNEKRPRATDDVREKKTTDVAGRCVSKNTQMAPSNLSQKAYSCKTSTIAKATSSILTPFKFRTRW